MVQTLANRLDSLANVDYLAAARNYKRGWI
jgi:hypothetical protein